MDFAGFNDNVVGGSGIRFVLVDDRGDSYGWWSFGGGGGWYMLPESGEIFEESLVWLYGLREVEEFDFLEQEDGGGMGGNFEFGLEGDDDFEPEMRDDFMRLVGG